MAAEEIAVDPYKADAQKLRILAENPQSSRLDRLVLTAMHQALIGQARAGEPGKAAGNDQTIGNLAA